MSTEIEGGLWLPPATVETCERVGWVSHMDRFYRRADTVVDKELAEKMAEAMRNIAGCRIVMSGQTEDGRDIARALDAVHKALDAYKEATGC